MQRISSLFQEMATFIQHQCEANVGIEEQFSGVDIYNVHYFRQMEDSSWNVFAHTISMQVPNEVCSLWFYLKDGAPTHELSRSAPPDEFVSVQSCIPTCPDDVLLWMNSYKPSWTHIKLRLWPLAMYLFLSQSTVSAQILAKTVFLSKRWLFRYLGVHLDGTLSVHQHISRLCRASFLELRRVASIRPYLSQSPATRLIAAMVISRLDYFNSVFTGLPADQIARLLRVQNNTAWFVMKKEDRDHVTPLLKELHWLPAKFRCQYKIATLTYPRFEGSLPPYFSSSLFTYSFSPIF